MPCKCYGGQHTAECLQSRPITKCTCGQTGPHSSICPCFSIGPAIDWSKPVQTRSKIPVRIIAINGPGEAPIIACVGAEDYVRIFKANGEYRNGHDYDLVQAPVEVNAWLNLYIRDGKLRLNDGGLHEKLSDAKYMLRTAANHQLYAHTIAFTFDEQGNYLRSEKIDLRKCPCGKTPCTPGHGWRCSI